MASASPLSGVNASVGTEYRTYKRATEKLADWLVTTATSVGLNSTNTFAGESNRDAIQGQHHCLSISDFNSLIDVIFEATPGYMYRRI